MVLRVKSSRCALYGSGHTSQQAAEGRRDSRTPGLAKDSVSRAQKPATSYQLPVTSNQDPGPRGEAVKFGSGLGFGVSELGWFHFQFCNGKQQSGNELLNAKTGQLFYGGL